jgi:opacity protein-like surface antigen
MINGEQRMDELLRNRLEQFSAEPHPRVWQGIQAGIAPAKNSSRVVYLRWLSAAAVLVLALISGILLIDRQSEIIPAVTEQIMQPAQPITDSNDNIKMDQIPSVNENIIIAQHTEPQSKIFPVNVFSESVAPNADEPRQQITLSRLRSIRAMLDTNLPGSLPIELPQTMTISADRLSEIDKMIVAANLTQAEIEKIKMETGWKVGVHLSPGVSSQTVSHSAQYARNMTYSEDNPQTNVGGGISVQYKTASRWRVETGMYYSKTGESSGNAFRFSSMRADFADAPRSSEKYFNTGVSNNMGQLAMNSTAGVIKFSHTPSNAELISMPEASYGLSTAMLSPGEFSQVFDFVEIPLFARYLLVDSKLGVELMGGFSTNILTGNNVYMENNSGREQVGSTEDISTMNFSGSAGVGLIYALGKNLSLSVEPRFSYYLNSINHSGDVSFKPWRVGVFTGLSYDF